MSRLPYAAHTLIEQVKAEKKRAKVEEVGEPDGFRVVRTIKFDKQTSKWLAPLLEVIDDDRIEAWGLTDADYLHITFSSGPIADQREQFPLADAKTIIDQR